MRPINNKTLAGLCLKTVKHDAATRKTGSKISPNPLKTNNLSKSPDGHPTPVADSEKGESASAVPWMKAMILMTPLSCIGMRVASESCRW